MIQRGFLRTKVLVPLVRGPTATNSVMKSSLQLPQKTAPRLILSTAEVRCAVVLRRHKKHESAGREARRQQGSLHHGIRGPLQVPGEFTTHVRN